MLEDKVPVKKRRFLAKDYDFLAEFIEEELGRRKALKSRKKHEALWREVDRQVSMTPMESASKDPDGDWKAALEMGDMATASEVLAADVLRLIFPQDRRSLDVHTNIDFKRLGNRTSQKPTEADRAKIQKKADSELRALMTQQHKDFGFRARIELSVKEALHHGSYIAEVEWEEVQQYAIGGVFKSAAAPVWTPHSMWNSYPETLELGVNMIYTGSMIFCANKDYDWISRQNSFINLKKFQDRTTDKNAPVEIMTWVGDITVVRAGENVFLPNMKIKVANKTVIFAKPMNNASIIFNGYDRVDLRDPYFMSPLIKQSTNSRIITIIANKFLDNVDLKLEPPVVYDGNDPTLIAQGGPKMIPGVATPTKGGVQNFKQIDVGDPSWAAQAIQGFKADMKEGIGVSASRAGAQRQADRITATQIEEEAAGANLRTVDFVGKVEKGIESFAYLQHEMNKENMVSYKFYNADMGMDDFDEIKKADLPKEVHFEMVGSKGVLSERRRAEQTNQVMTFLLSHPATERLVNTEAMAKQMLLDAGNKNPESLLLVSEGDEQLVAQIEALKEQMQAAVQELEGKLREVTQKLVESEMEAKIGKDQLKLRNERAEGTENHLRGEIRSLKAEITRTSQLMEELGKLQDETAKQEKIQQEINHNKEVQNASAGAPVPEKAPSQPPVIVNIQKAGGHKVIRDKVTGDMSALVTMDGDEANEVAG